MTTEAWLAAITTDSLALRHLQRVAEASDLQLRILDNVNQLVALEPPPHVVVVDLDGCSLEEAGRLKAHHPRVMLAGFIGYPDPDRWRSGLDAGFDLITTRGALAKQLAEKISQWRLQPGGPRLRLFALADIAGRIGLVKRIDETPVGPLAVYHLGGEVLAVEDLCPHAGAHLSEGEVSVEQAVITCPRHGSRFDLRTGARTRGPADDPIGTFRVQVEGTEVYVRL